MRLSKLRTDPTLEKTGVEVFWKGDVVLRLRRIGNDEYQQAIDDECRPYRALQREDALPAETWRKIVDKCLARAVLVGWSGILEDENDADGKPVEVRYSPEMAYEILSDRRYHDFRSFVLTEANRMENFVGAEVARDLGKPKPSSNGRADSGSTKTASERSPDSADPSAPSTSSPDCPTTSVGTGEPSASSTSPASG